MAVPQHVRNEIPSPIEYGKAGMAERVYIETTIVSYLTARPYRDVVIACTPEELLEAKP